MAGRAVAQRPRLLLVTDSWPEVESFQRLLAPIGETILAHTEAEALGWLMHQSFDVVLWDLAIGARDPLEQHQRLAKGDVGWTEQVAYIARGAPFGTDTAYSASVPNGVLGRPVVPRELLRVVARLCARRHATEPRGLAGASAARGAAEA